MAIYIRFEAGVEDRMSQGYGPFEWVQLTYTTLRAIDGTDIAYFDNAYGEWRFAGAGSLARVKELTGVEFASADVDTWWSDVVIYNEADKTPGDPMDLDELIPQADDAIDTVLDTAAALEEVIGEVLAAADYLERLGRQAATSNVPRRVEREKRRLRALLDTLNDAAARKVF